MDNEEQLEEVLSKVRNYKWSLLFGGGGILLLLYGLFAPSITPHGTEPLEFKAGNETQKSIDENSTEETIVVDIAGAVKKPGVYAVQKNARLQDAIQKAEGFTSDANTSYIAKNINLAQLLTDGTKIYIPFQNENGEVAGASRENTKVSVNTASSAELEALPGIGVQTAAKIIKLRPYSSLSELVSKKAIGNALFEKLKEQLSL